MKRGRIGREDPVAQAHWARIQREFTRQGQRDFKEIWTEPEKARQTEAATTPPRPAPLAGPRRMSRRGERE